MGPLHLPSQDRCPHPHQLHITSGRPPGQVRFGAMFTDSLLTVSLVDMRWMSDRIPRCLEPHPAEAASGSADAGNLRAGASRHRVGGHDMRAWPGFCVMKLKGPDFGLVSRPLLPGTLKFIIWGNDDNTVLTILALMPRPL
ncbi:hypothetical protein MG293_016433 [Ovis ammon polii]|uniref:Uncharacterized protein n=1 Tax=Ovis ammon polii TaxID=230172 RepID=A0AAD4TW20_OVIAM|nr:hypothetical protein MG293_016433 [Ovis ammon polii]